MNISQRFIQYPIMTTLLSVALVVFGIFGYSAMPVSEMPNVELPTITVSASLSGADPETMAATVASPLEVAFTSVAGVNQMTSTSTQGRTQITVQFDSDHDIDSAALDIQSAIAGAVHNLPRTMISPPTYRKVNPADQPVYNFALSSTTLPLTTVDFYAETILGRQVSALDGVAQLNLGGATQYAVRIQADPSALAARGIGIDTLARAIGAANIEEATGALNGKNQAQIIHTDAQLKNADQYRKQIIAYKNGAPVRIGDVANVVDGSSDTRSGGWYQGRPTIILMVMKQPGANTLKIADSIQAAIPRIKALLPTGVTLGRLYDRTQTINAAIHDVKTTLLISGLLVVGVIFLFLRKASATIIPSLALPISVIGTFAAMWLLGYGIDTLSMMALTLSVGFVVDDAIVMLENIVRHIEQGEKPYDAAMKGSAEIGFTILSMTLSLAAVFIPIVFMGGLIGLLLHEFAVTIILAVLFSGLVSITLTPMLCARFLRDERAEKHNLFYRISENAFTRVQNFYDRTLRWGLAHKPFIMALFVLSIVASYGLLKIMPMDFIPSDDTGQLRTTVQAANGTSYENMVKYAREVEAVFEANPNVLGGDLRVGGDGLGSAGSSSAAMNILLKPWAQRTETADQVAADLRKATQKVEGVNVFITNPPMITIGGRFSRSSYQYTLQGIDLHELQDVSERMVAALKEAPGFVGVNSDFDRPAPSLEVAIDRDRAAAMGVTATQIENALGYAFGGQQVSQIYEASNAYQVVLELLPSAQTTAASLRNLYVTGTDGTQVPLSAVTTVTSGTIPLQINHQGELPAITISFDLQKGYALSDAVTSIAKASQDINMPATITGSFEGTLGAFQSSMQNMGMLLFVAVLVVYIILGILYESFIHPLTILSGLPSAAVGALLTLYIVGLPLTLYAFVGMIMLVGIVKKNAIMMIDFALQRERGDGGVSAEQAIYEAAIIRFRPIMMTTMAALMGSLPIAFGVGEGAASRRPLGLCVAGGLLLSQLLTLYITPVIYIYLDRLSSMISNWRPFGRTSNVPAE